MGSNRNERQKSHRKIQRFWICHIQQSLRSWSCRVRDEWKGLDGSICGIVVVSLYGLKPIIALVLNFQELDGCKLKVKLSGSDGSGEEWRWWCWHKVERILYPKVENILVLCAFLVVIQLLPFKGLFPGLLYFNSHVWLEKASFIKSLHRYFKFESTI